MIPAEQPTASAPRPWGIVMTTVWTLVVAFAAVILSSVALMVWFPNLTSASDVMADTQLFGTMFAVSIVAEIVVLAVAARLAGWRTTTYLGLVPASRRDTMIAVGSIVVFMIAFDILTYLLEKDVVTPFQDELYRNAGTTGAVLLMLIALVIAAPVGEEILFRGFLYRGWAQTPRAVLPAIVVISALWAVIHTQYDWYGIFQIFLIGLLLGWVRWRSGSTLLTILQHAIINAWATLQTVFVVEWLGA